MVLIFKLYLAIYFDFSVISALSDYSNMLHREYSTLQFCKIWCFKLFKHLYTNRDLR